MNYYNTAHNEFAYSDAISPLVMPPIQYQIATAGISTPLVYPDPRRSMNSTANTTPCSSKRNSARITKLRSTDNSPRHIQRRRSTAAQHPRSNAGMAANHGSWTREQRLWDYYKANEARLGDRPSSWHPGFISHQTPEPFLTSVRPGVRNTVTGMENLALSSTPPTSSQSFQTAMPVNQGYRQDTNYLPYHVSQMDASQAIPTFDPSFYTYPSYESSQPLQDYHIEEPPAYAARNMPDLSYRPLQQGQQDITYPIYMTNMNSATQTVHIANCNTQPVATEKVVAPTTQLDGEELVGIGLYDDKQCSGRSTLHTTAPMNRLSFGKDLKLEETWKPAADIGEGNAEDAVDEDTSIDDDDDDEDGAGSAFSEADDDDEEEDEVEHVLSTLVTPSQAQRPSVMPNYNDLANRSFYFSDETDPYANSEPYADYLALTASLDNGAQKQKPHAVTDGAVDNAVDPTGLLWF